LLAKILPMDAKVTQYCTSIRNEQISQNSWPRAKILFNSSKTGKNLKKSVINASCFGYWSLISRAGRIRPNLFLKSKHCYLL